jgi:DNA-binding NtrC family response regulator
MCGLSPLQTVILQRRVAEGRFREDLFFRLNVFPLSIPSLCERREDIPMLAAHFAAKFTREFGKPLRMFKESDMQRLVAREWKGNIRELAHLVEQAVIVSEGSSLDFSTILSLPEPALERSIPGEIKTMHDFEHDITMMEKELIVDALERSNGRVSGAGGAAVRLAMHPKNPLLPHRKAPYPKTLSIIPTPHCPPPTADCRLPPTPQTARIAAVTIGIPLCDLFRGVVAV